jgi:hypothetical protein
MIAQTIKATQKLVTIAFFKASETLPKVNCPSNKSEAIIILAASSTPALMPSARLEKYGSARIGRDCCVPVLFVLEGCERVSRQKNAGVVSAKGLTLGKWRMRVASKS